MTEHGFTLRYRLNPADSDIDDIIERLGAAGCNDALVGMGVPGWIALDFTREATDASEAVTSAIADVKKAIPSAVIESVTLSPR